MIFQRIRFTLLIVLIAFLFSCRSNQRTEMSKKITGRAGELVVVISDESWDGNPGKIIRHVLAREHSALPQDEPLFDLIRVPHEGFKSIFKTTRNILQTHIYENINNPGITFKDNVWASPQATVTISARNEEEFENLFNVNSNLILNYFLKAEKNRLIMNYDKIFERGIFNVLQKDFGITLKVPPGFQIANQKKDFIWLRYETPEISQGIIVYTFPYVSDSAFTVDYQLKVRDSILQANIPGPTEGSFMATERRVDQFTSYREHNGNYASEMRGLWRLINDYMGGPYISLAELDAAGQRVVVAFGYVYAPSKNKRNLLRQVEAMVYSLKLNNQAENDKLKEQLIDIDVLPENMQSKN